MASHAARARFRSAHTTRNIALIVLGVIIVLVGVLIVGGLTFYKQAQTVKNHETQAISAISAISDSNVLNGDGI